MACDHRVGTAGDFKVGVNELALGLTLPAAALEILRGSLVPRTTRRVVLGAELFDPTHALEHGLLDDVASDVDACIDRSCSVARRLGRARAEFASLKGVLVAPIVVRFKDQRAVLDRRFLDTWFSEDGVRLRAAATDRLRSNNRPD